MDKEWFYAFYEQDYFRKTPEQVDKGVTQAIPHVEFLMDVLELSLDDRILDLCCGYGAHAITLARRGYNITGFDLCKRALRLARGKAQRDNVEIPLVRGDMRWLPFKGGFDVVYNYFSSFGYFEDDSQDLMVLEGAARALKPGGRFLIENINGAKILSNFQQASPNGSQKRTYDAETGRLRAKWKFVNEDTGESREHPTVQRLYSIDELSSMLDSVGLRPLNAYGDIRKTEYGKDSSRMIILARKI